MKAETTTPAACYVRMSNTAQEASPEKQRIELRKLAERFGFQITEWYDADLGMSGTRSKNRKDFQRLLADAVAGKFKAVLLWEQSRMSREDTFDAMMHFKLLKDAGVDIYTCQRGKLDFDTMGGMITAIVDQYTARQESQTLGRRVVEGKRIAIDKGMRISRAPFGFDRQIYDNKGTLVRTLTYREKFTRPKGWTSKLVPTSNQSEIDAIHFMFEQYAAGRSLRSITIDLNKRGLRTRDNKDLRYSTIRCYLRNPVYVGDTLIGSEPRGQFARIIEGDAVLKSGTHQGIIDRKLFARVQARLDGAKTPGFRRRETSFLLSGMVFCQVCGGRCYGNNETVYKCVAQSHGITCNGVTRVSMPLLDSIVLGIVAEALSPNRDAIEKAVARKSRRRSVPDTQSQIELLQANIAKATRNAMLLDDPQAVREINQSILSWRAEEKRLTEQTAKVHRAEQLAPGAQAVIRSFAEMLPRLDTADKDKLREALFTTIEKVSYTRTLIRDERRWHTIGTVVFKDGLGIEPQVFDVADAKQWTDWQMVHAWLLKQPQRTATAEAVAAEFAFDYTTLRRRLLKAVESGAVKRVNRRQFQAVLQKPTKPH